MLVKEEQPLKHSLPKDVTDDGITMLVKEEQPLKLISPNSVTAEGIVMLDKAVRRAEHTARSAGLVADSDNLAIVENIVTAFADKHSHKALDNVTTCVKLTGIYVLIELANQMLKDIAHLYTVIGLGV